jgi:putative ABC transport system substrate-binding protein
VARSSFLTGFPRWVARPRLRGGSRYRDRISVGEGNWERLPDIAAELVGLKVDVLMASVCGPTLNAAMRATNTIPIVVAACNDDMVETGIIANLAHPGGNVTGLSKMTPELTAKRLELLKEMMPEASRVAVLWDPGYSAYLADWRELRERARTRRVTLQSFEARNVADLGKAFAAIVHERADAVITLSDTVTYIFSNQVADLAARSRLPLMSPFEEVTRAGGLMSYGPSIPDMYRRAAGYVDKILRGAKPADCRWNSRRSLSSPSISRRQKHSGSLCHRHCSPAPTS